jgi:hypothetical protein
MDPGHIVMVSLDGKPLATSGKILLQAMTEEEPSGFRTVPEPPGRKRIVDLGTDPWMVKRLSGQVEIKRTDAAAMKVTLLDLNGYPVKSAGSASRIDLDPATVYYLIEK